jgi:hypothetical protein
MDARALGLTVVALGIVAVVVGLVIYAGGLSWFGRLPGDIRIENDGFRLYIPIVSMLLVSLVLSLLSIVLRRFF